MCENEPDPTSRSRQRGDAQGLVDGGNTNVRQPAARIRGAPKYSDEFKLFANVGIDLGYGMDAYTFGNLAERVIRLAAKHIGARSGRALLKRQTLHQVES